MKVFNNHSLYIFLCNSSCLDIQRPLTVTVCEKENAIANQIKGERRLCGTFPADAA